MKKLLFLFIITITIISCGDSQQKDDIDSSLSIRGNQSPLKVVVIDSCEYLFGPWGSSSVLTHKGNCKFCKGK